jgi:hypothetical protein
MEHVFYLTHLRLVSFSLYFLPTRRLRKLVEYLCITSAIISLITLIYLHRTYVSSNESKQNCLCGLFPRLNDVNTSDSQYKKSDVFLINSSYSIIRINIIPIDWSLGSEALPIRYIDTTENYLDLEHQYKVKPHPTTFCILQNVSLDDSIAHQCVIKGEEEEGDTEAVLKYQYLDNSNNKSHLYFDYSDRSSDHSSLYLYTMERDIILPPKHG